MFIRQPLAALAWAIFKDPAGEQTRRRNSKGRTTNPRGWEIPIAGGTLTVEDHGRVWWGLAWELKNGEDYLGAAYGRTPMEAAAGALSKLHKSIEQVQESF